ncbi:hypothetical protein GGX14DRAFT_427913 [Mycena pura]|uniref:Uncharacterized protein n=1 Tax=Mycena pura TaxID=153505 RepID=A0AAD6YMQ7_9AGAR|nr:hypothetical protein GGX14DRAFT_427913 [Mycena pura]
MSAYWTTNPTAGFTHDPAAPLQDEFARLAQLRGWTAGGKAFRREWAHCGRLEFEYHFGGQPTLTGWQAMCAFVGVARADVPNSVTQCKEALRKTFVNIVDLMDARRTGQPVKQHKSAKALKKYTIDSGKIFPKEAAKRNGYLKVLLIEIFATSTR